MFDTRFDALVADLKAAALAQELPKKKLAEAACLHPNSLRRFGDPDWNPSLATLRKLDKLLAPPAAAPKRRRRKTHQSVGGN